MCRHCRAFQRQLKSIGRAARRISDGFEREPSPDFERTIVKRFSRLRAAAAFFEGCSLAAHRLLRQPDRQDRLKERAACHASLSAT
jgi:hypothetical protein